MFRFPHTRPHPPRFNILNFPSNIFQVSLIFGSLVHHEQQKMSNKQVGIGTYLPDSCLVHVMWGDLDALLLT